MISFHSAAQIRFAHLSLREARNRASLREQSDFQLSPSASEHSSPHVVRKPKVLRSRVDERKCANSARSPL
jgi:hypothetical protein